jgi:hypothetical protein
VSKPKKSTKPVTHKIVTKAIAAERRKGHAAITGKRNR